MPEKTREHQINEEITASPLRVFAADQSESEIISRAAALAMADEAGFDLVEISPKAEPPVCRIMDYGKFIFEEGKKKSAAKKKQKQVQIKEIKFRPGTGEGDYQIKLRNLMKFLEQGNKTKITIRYRGREMAHRELGMEMLKRIEKDLEEYGKVEQFPKMEGRQMIMVVGPISKKK
ncbi:MAG: translation initiation factor IF-3 [Gammaproteobacteria bacterium]|jgi:translation initiation factor IF-3|nr:translation initiation factor IF-3 [Gammaproteobacteria bacterium]MBT4605667.1 translation initiation factor IF-3 [Thiotrichales bacterium]MBT3472668.1 translation initiation factor IF-3 [Gammaproteobacteria bacterium]MBT3968478.1 translation initiation factor IF-3 [Gammaproteobacteria bacterium]MBT4079978.1 translation initiation factor IF-3 [Gammaproteobacteria bacterium]